MGPSLNPEITYIAYLIIVMSVFFLSYTACLCFNPYSWYFGRLDVFYYDTVRIVCILCITLPTSGRPGGKVRENRILIRTSANAVQTSPLISSSRLYGFFTPLTRRFIYALRAHCCPRKNVSRPADPRWRFFSRNSQLTGICVNAVVLNAFNWRSDILFMERWFV